jgi:crossover junction endodeoxyribonuclease RuvC
MIEEIFVSQNPRSALRLGMARGVAIQVCGAAGLGVGEIAARAAKQAVTGTGRADKKQMAAMVARLLMIEAPPSDAADALAIAIAGVQSGNNFSAQKGSAPAGSGLQAAIAAALAKETL